jgi:hypothetical protein
MRPRIGRYPEPLTALSIEAAESRTQRTGVMRTGQVFVSHTSDMDQFPVGRSFVQASLDAIGRVGMAPVDMRYFAARDGKPADYCRRRVRECEIYVAVIGFRYGSIVPGQAVSYTELEFDEASAAGLPRLVFLLDESGRLPAALTDADRGAVDRFRQRLRTAGLMVRTFTSADTLELEVLHALKEATEGGTGSGSDGGPVVPGLGEVLFSARIKEPNGPLVVGFGAGESLVAVERDATVHRWSLEHGNGLPGMPRGEMLRAGYNIVASTGMTAIAVARDRRLSIVHFGPDGYTSTDLPLGRDEFLVKTAGERFATFDGRRVAVRDFGDGSVLWQQPCPRNVAAAAIDPTGTAVAIAGGPYPLGGSNKITFVASGDPAPREFCFDNFPMFGAACQLGMSEGGALVACASFREVLLLRPRDRQVLQRRRLGRLWQEVVPALGARPQRLICTPGGQVIWLRGRRIALIRWTPPELHYLQQKGDCDDIAFDPGRSRLAIVSQSGRVDVWKWRD